MDSPRAEVFRTAREYFGAAARYWQAALRGEDMETPTQDLLGRSLFYEAALKNCHEDWSARRREALRRRMLLLSSRYG